VNVQEDKAHRIMLHQQGSGELMIHNQYMDNTTTSLDPTDHEIIRILRSEGRLGGAEIGRRVNLSQPAVSARIKRLEETGTIVGYHAQVDHKSMGLPIHAVVRLRTTQANITPALELFVKLPEIIRIYRLTGEDCFLLDLYVADAESLETIVDSIARFGPVTTSLVLREYPTRHTSEPGSGQKIKPEKPELLARGR
jgi:Lrp/AsnC family transcriptional regulator, leucine-responsive regulatory protein